jgi:hypothetical protein
VGCDDNGSPPYASRLQNVSLTADTPYHIQIAGKQQTIGSVTLYVARYVAADFVVNTQGYGTCGALAQCGLATAVSMANTAAGVETMNFDIPGQSTHTIFISGTLRIEDSAVIDATTQWGYMGTPKSRSVRH